MFYIIAFMLVILFPITAMTYYAVKRNKNILHNGRFLKFRVTVDNNADAIK